MSESITATMTPNHPMQRTALKRDCACLFAVADRKRYAT